jgi:hypothetical protein
MGGGYRIAGFASSGFYFYIYIEMTEEVAVSSACMIEFPMWGKSTEKDANTIFS